MFFCILFQFWNQLFIKKKCVFVWLCWALVAAYGSSLCLEGSSVMTHGLPSCEALAEMLCGMWDLSSYTKDWIWVLCIAWLILNHWIRRDIPQLVIFHPQKGVFFEIRVNLHRNLRWLTDNVVFQFIDTIYVYTYVCIYIPPFS